MAVESKKCAHLPCLCMPPAGEKYCSQFCEEDRSGGNRDRLRLRASGLCKVSPAKTSFSDCFVGARDFLHRYTTSTRDALPWFSHSLSVTTALAKPQGGCSCRRFWLCSWSFC